MKLLHGTTVRAGLQAPSDALVHGVSEKDLNATVWLKPEQAAAYLGIALGTLRNLTSQRRMPHSRRGRIVRYRRDRLDRWLDLGACPGRITKADSQQKPTTKLGGKLNG
jgi:excisionase family DNA binding protein